MDVPWGERSFDHGIAADSVLSMGDVPLAGKPFVGGAGDIQ
jgi:hypothetical protein